MQAHRKSRVDRVCSHTIPKSPVMMVRNTHPHTSRARGTNATSTSRDVLRGQEDTTRIVGSVLPATATTRLFPFRRWQKSREHLGDRCKCMWFGERQSEIASSAFCVGLQKRILVGVCLVCSGLLRCGRELCQELDSSVDQSPQRVVFRTRPFRRLITNR